MVVRMMLQESCLPWWAMARARAGWQTPHCCGTRQAREHDSHMSALFFWDHTHSCVSVALHESLV